MQLPEDKNLTPGQKIMFKSGWTPADTIRHRDWIEIRWIHPSTGEVYSQVHALRILRAQRKRGHKGAHAGI